MTDSSENERAAVAYFSQKNHDLSFHILEDCMYSICSFVTSSKFAERLTQSFCSLSQAAKNLKYTEYIIFQNMSLCG